MKDETGSRYGRLVVNSKAESDSKKNTKWVCLCDCGKEKVVRGDCLRNGTTQSCGCLAKERAAEAQTTHGMHKTKEYMIWSSMKSRCFNNNNRKYPLYGGRGVTVCDRWINSFEMFYEDMGKPGEGLSIDRINNNGDYEPENCRWATITEQNRNRSNTRTITIGNVTIPAVEYAAKHGLDYVRFAQSVFRNGKSVEYASNKFKLKYFN